MRHPWLDPSVPADIPTPHDARLWTEPSWGHAPHAAPAWRRPQPTGEPWAHGGQIERAELTTRAATVGAVPTLSRRLRRPDRPARTPATGARSLGAAALVGLLTLSGCGLLDDAGTPASSADGSGVGVRGATGSPTPSPGTSDPSALPTFDPGTAVGGYAKGFPAKLLGAPEDATVLASSATAGDGALTDVTLNLSTTRSTQEVIDQLADRLREAGFEESGTSTFSGLTAQTTFGRESTPKGTKDADPVVESVTLGVLDDGERRLVTVSGSVVAG
jgi:hypothetical protein